MVHMVRAIHVLQWVKQKEAKSERKSEENNTQRTESNLKKILEGGFGSNHKVASYGELQHTVRTNRPSKAFS